MGNADNLLRLWPALFQNLSNFVELLKNRILTLSLLLYGIIGLSLATSSHAQLTSGELYRSFENQIGIADTTSNKLIAGRQATASQLNEQALEAPVDPNTYILGPGDGVYLNVYAIHGLDQDLTVTPEGRLLIPVIGSVEVSGLSITQAEKKVRNAVAKDYKSADVSLSLRHLRPMKVNIVGDVLKPGIQTTTALMRVSEVIDKSGGFKPSSSLRNIEIRSPTGQLRARADLFRYYALGDLPADPVVQEGDVIMVPSATKYVTVSGNVGNEQRLEFVNGDSLSTAIALCRGFLPAADRDSIEISRFPQNDPVHAEWLWFDYSKGENPALHDGDQIFIRAFSQYHVPRIVSIDGEVPFPGRYPIAPGTTRLKDIIDRAGGPLSNASLDQAQVFRRVGLGTTDPELKRIQFLVSLRKEGLSDEEYDYYAARSYPNTMVVDFRALMNGDQSQNLVLREWDSVYIPRAMGYVTVSGSVNRQGNVEYIQGGTWRDYVEKAGGFSEMADRSSIRVVDPQTGAYINPRDEAEYKIIPGDLIIVPRAEPHFWKDVGAVTALTAQILTIVAGIYLLLKK